MDFSELGLLKAYNFKSNQPILVDVGAHHGSVSFAFADKGWQVIAFEPEHNNRQAFKKNLSQFSNVICIDKAVSDVTGEKVPFYTSNKHFGIHSLKPFHRTHKPAYEVETVRLDNALIKLNVSDVTLLKIDIEGADLLALKGFDFTKYQPEIVMVEFMDERSLENFNYSHHDMVSFMENVKYTCFISEWQAFKEYGRDGQESEPHKWIQCAPYPLEHEPVWGNLIFVPEKDKDKFPVELKNYLQNLTRARRVAQFRNLIKKIPGAKAVYNSLR